MMTKSRARSSINSRPRTIVDRGAWKTHLREAEGLTDGLGMKLALPMLQTVASLTALGYLADSASFGREDRKGIFYPWVLLAAPGHALRKQRIATTAKSYHYLAMGQEAAAEVSQIRASLSALIDGFYESHKPTSALALCADNIHAEELPDGTMLATGVRVSHKSVHLLQGFPGFMRKPVTQLFRSEMQEFGVHLMGQELQIGPAPEPPGPSGLTLGLNPQ